MTTSMTTAALIQKFVEEFPNDELLTRRMLVPFGNDAAVDNAIYRLIHISGRLIRVSHGVYRKRERVSSVPISEIISAKAKAFGRDLITSAQQVAFNLGLCESAGAAYLFHTNGRSSSFKVGDEDVILKGASPRKMALGDSFVGRAIRALWFLGKEAISEHLIGHATRSFSPSQLEEMGSLGASMPHWLRMYCYPYKLLSEVERAKDIYRMSGRKSLWLKEGEVQYKIFNVFSPKARSICA